MKQFFFSAILAMSAIAASAQEDVTSLYMTNPSFEADDISTWEEGKKDTKRGGYNISVPQGWSNSSVTAEGESWGSSLIYSNAEGALTIKETDNGFGLPGTPSDGTQMYYLRNAWVVGGATVNFTQKVNLPAGKYKLTLDSKCVTGNAANGSAKLVAGSESKAIDFAYGEAGAMPADWTNTDVEFNVEEDGEVTVGVTVTYANNKAGVSVLMDNFRLYKMAEEEEETATAVENVKASNEDAVIYDLSGRRVKNTVKGNIYIVNGKKVIIK